MRVQSAMSKTFRDGQIGYIHLLNGDLPGPPPKPERPPPAVNCSKLIGQWVSGTKREQLAKLSDDLHVSVLSLASLQVCWSPEHHAWAIPMQDAYGNMVGIRLRADNGTKWSVRGSHSGCFIPNARTQPLALVVEGPTDTAAGLDLGFYTVGRPAASGGIDQLKHFFRLRNVKRAVIVADNDTVGVNGAIKAADAMGIPTVVIVLPCKDLRDFLKFGGDNRLLTSIIENSVWRV